ncbi:hypothetical protein BVX95_01635 [archaeon D22]|nr:hypothetical protein BVX95_01635 [archaeon D22]
MFGVVFGEEIVRIILIYLVPFSVSVMIYWLTCNMFNERKRILISVFSFTILLSIFSFVSEEVIRIALFYVVPFGMSLIVYANTEDYSPQKRLILSVATFIILLSIAFLLTG